MKRATLTLSILCALNACVIGGPEPSGKDMKQVAPMPPPCPNWTGFYIGGFGGYKFASTDINLDLGGTGFAGAFAPAARETEDQTRDLDIGNGEAGGLLGYNYQWHNWVFGVEAAGSYLWLDRSESHDFFNAGNEYLTDASLESHYLFTFAPRIGYALCRWLPFVTAGLAVGDIDFSQSTIGLDLGNIQGGSVHETNIGYMIGGGLEYALNDHWRVRAQYQFIDLGSVDFDHTVNLPALFNGQSEAELREHNASVAIIYGF
jgi:outer membrane immunogenic protein